MRISYNSPVILSFALISSVVMLMDTFYLKFITDQFFVIYPDMNFGNPLSYFRLFSHVIGHANWGHLLGNFTLILLLGPMLEEKYGSKLLLAMILVTALVTGILNVSLFDVGLLGASGVVFMLILLSSFTNFKSGEIPLTFILVVFLFLGREVVTALEADNISQFAHIAGGLCGSVFGGLLVKENAEEKRESSSSFNDSWVNSSVRESNSPQERKSFKDINISESDLGSDSGSRDIDIF